MALFRFHVTEHVDRAVATGDAPQILNFFEHPTQRPTDEFKIGGKRENTQTLELKGLGC
jgi:hypothetical protein